MFKIVKSISTLVAVSLVVALGMVAAPLAGVVEAQLPCGCGNICVNTTGWWLNGGDFNASATPIQDAVNNATSGDVICVEDGSYNENVVVNTSHLTIQSQNGTASCTVSASDPNNDVFNITAEWVNITGLTVQNATGTAAGIHLVSVANYGNISGNNVTNNYRGIYLGGRTTTPSPTTMSGTTTAASTWLLRTTTPSPTTPSGTAPSTAST